MKKIILLLLLLGTACSFSYSQTVTKKATGKKKTKTKTTTVAKSTVPVPGKEVTVTLKNLSEGTIAIFAGARDEMKNTLKKKTVGGLSKNILYLRVNDVVCVLKGVETVACVPIKSTTTLLEINISGNGIVAK